MLLLIFGTADPIYGVMIVAVVGPLLTYLVAARRLSGQIRNSEATELWAESRSIREWSEKRNEKLEEHISELDERINGLEMANGALAKENRELQKANYELKTENERLKLLLTQAKGGSQQ